MHDIEREIGKEGQGAMATMVAVAQALGSVAVSLTALTVIIVEGVPMLYEAFKKAKLAQGRARKDARRDTRKDARRDTRRNGRPGRTGLPAATRRTRRGSTSPSRRRRSVIGARPSPPSQDPVAITPRTHLSRC